MTKYILTILIYLVSVIFANSQNEQVKGRYSNGERPKIGKISGRVIDKSQKTAIEYASIVLISARTGKAVTGGVTSEKGYFSLSEIPVGMYKVKISFIGYTEMIIDSVKLTPRTPEKQFGTLKLKSNVQGLGEVKIEGEKALFQNTLEKKVFNVEKDLTSEGGNVVEILENVPSIDVDMDGNVSLRGSQNVTILIDGKPSGLSGENRADILEQIPASSIESIEVITNPSAKYNPEGMSGIINIRLKKNKLRGTNGTVRLNAGTGDKYNGSLGINHRNGKFNIFANYSYRYNKRGFTRTSTLKQLYTDSVSYLNQLSDGYRGSYSHMLNGGFDYYINDKNTISFSAMYNDSERWRLYDIDYDYLDDTEILTKKVLRNNDNGRVGNNFNYSLDYRKEFEKPNTELNINGAYTNSISEKNGTYLENEYTALDSLLTPDYFYQKDNIYNNSQEYITSIDYVNALSKDSRFEIGYKTNIRLTDNELFSETFDYILDNFAPDTLMNNTYNYEEQIHAAYATYTNKFKKLSYTAGLRAEQVYTEFDLITTKEIYTNDYFQLYPSLHLSQELSNKQTVQLSYSRRVNRPSIRSLNPFVNFQDPLNLRVGNPKLNPEYINSIELGYEKKWEKTTILSSIYYKQINNMVQRVKTLDDNGISTVTYENLSSGTSYGVEFIAVVNPVKWQSFNANFNMYQTVLDGSNLDADLNSNSLGWNAKFISNTKLPQKTNLQVSFRYRSPRETTQGTILAMYNVDAALNKKILKNKGTIGVKVSDIFNTRKFAMELYDTNFEQNFEYNFESRIFYLTFSYRFGKMMDMDKKKRKRSDNRDSDDDMGM